jgi:hypothetical protein
MRLFPIAVLLILGSAVNFFAQSTKSSQLWIPVDIKWTRLPGAPRNVPTRTASSIVLYFGKDGGFVRDECSLVRDGTSISISNGDPHNEYVGQETEMMVDGMRIMYRLVRRTVEKDGEVLPGPAIMETASTIAKTGLAVGGQFFRPVKLANEREYMEAYGALAQQYAQK